MPFGIHVVSALAIVTLPLLCLSGSRNAASSVTASAAFLLSRRPCAHCAPKIALPMASSWSLVMRPRYLDVLCVHVNRPFLSCEAPPIGALRDAPDTAGAAAGKRAAGRLRLPLAGRGCGVSIPDKGPAAALRTPDERPLWFGEDQGGERIGWGRQPASEGAIWPVAAAVRGSSSRQGALGD